MQSGRAGGAVSWILAFCPRLRSIQASCPLDSQHKLRALQTAKLPSGSTATTSPSTFNQRADIKKQSPGTFFWLNRQVVKKNRTNQQIYRSVPHSPNPPIIYLLFCQSSIWKIVSPPSGAPQILLLISILFFPQNSQESSVYEKV